MSGLAGAQTAVYGLLANRAQFRRQMRMVLAAAPAQAVSRHFSQPLQCFHAEVRARCTPATANGRRASLPYLLCSVPEVSLVAPFFKRILGIRSPSFGRAGTHSKDQLGPWFLGIRRPFL